MPKRKFIDGIRSLMPWLRFGRPRLITAPEFRNAAANERLRLYRNGSFLTVALFYSDDRLSADVLSVLEQQLRKYLSPIDTAGLTHDGCVGVLLPGYPAEDARSMAETVIEFCRTQDLHVQYELICYPDEPFDKLVDNSHEHWQSENANSSPAGVIFAVSIPVGKRLIDIGVSSIALLLTSPLILIAAFFIKTTSNGTVFYSQRRTGQSGEPFTIYKLRTMRMDADRHIADMRQMNELDGPAFKLKNDPRVLPVGKILRSLSIDELPQLWNVIIGDMSLVGPRPLPVDEASELTFWERERHDVKPGITGPWQVSGRNEISFAAWMRLDVDYARNNDLWKDCLILMRTIPAVLSGRGAS